MSIFYRRDLVTDQKLEKRLETEADLVDGKVPASQLPTPAPQEAWIAPTLVNSWAKVLNTPANEPAGFYKDEFGIVRLRGWLANGTAGSVFTLPVGYRPPLSSIHIARGQVNSNFLSFLGISVSSAGTVFVVTNNGVGDGDTVQAVSLSGITFRAE
jgi:hypothetical protein